MEHGSQAAKFIFGLSSFNGDEYSTMQCGVTDQLRHADTQRCCTHIEAFGFIKRNPKF